MSALEREPRRAAGASLRLGAMLRIARQELRDTLLGWAIYVTAALGLAIAAFLLYNSLRFTAESGLSIIARPFFNPLLIASTLALLFVSVNAALAVARPREQGALQLLFYAPVDSWTVVGAHFLSGVATYGMILALLLPPLLLLAMLTNYVIPTALLIGLLPTVLAAGLAVAFGLFISTFATSGRAAILLLVLAILLLFAIQGSYLALLNIPPTSRYYDTLRLARLFLGNTMGLLRWVSPFQLLDQFLGSAIRGGWGALAQQALTTIGGTALWLLAAVASLKRRGVLPGG